MARSRRSDGRQRGGKQADVARWLGEGWRSLTEGNAVQAAALFRRATRQLPEHAGAWHGLGVALQALGQVEEAHDALQLSVRLNPQQPEAWFALAQVMDARHRTLEARDAMRRAVTLAQELGYEEAVLKGMRVALQAIEHGLKRLQHEMGTADEAVLERAYTLFSEGVEAFGREDYATAVEKFRQSVELTPNHARAWGNLGAALMMVGQLDEAEDALQQALALHPDYEPARENLRLLRKMRAEPGTRDTVHVHTYTQVKRGAPRRRSLR